MKTLIFLAVFCLPGPTSLFGQQITADYSSVELRICATRYLSDINDTMSSLIVRVVNPKNTSYSIGDTIEIVRIQQDKFSSQGWKVNHKPILEWWQNYTSTSTVVSCASCYAQKWLYREYVKGVVVNYVSKSPRLALMSKK